MTMRPAFIAVVVLVGCSQPDSNTMKIRTIEYRGQQFQMAGDFADFEEYRDTADRIAEQDQQKVSDAVRRATVPNSVASIEELSRAIGQVAFPGFESGTLVVKDKAQIGQYYGMHAMIPYTDFSRFFIYAQRDTQLQLLHETELERHPYVYHFSVDHEKIVYYRSDGMTHEFARQDDGAER